MYFHTKKKKEENYEKETRKTQRNATRMIMLVMNLIVSPVWAAPGDVTINKTNFPDAAFLGYVKAKIDNNDDGILSQSEIDVVK